MRILEQLFINGRKFPPVFFVISNNRIAKIAGKSPEIYGICHKTRIFVKISAHTGMQKNTCLFVGISFMVICLFAADLMFGSVDIPLSEIMRMMFGGEANSITREIIINIRIPKAITAILAGAGLSVSGLMMQTLFRNPLAGPYILGVSSGATLGVAAVMMSGTLLGIALQNEWLIITAAIIGALSVLLLVLGVSFRIRNAVSLLIIGIMFGNIAGALVNVMQNYSNPDSLKLFIIWTFGSLSAVTWEQMLFLVPVTVIGLLLALALVKPLNGFLLGENYARGLGISIKRIRLLIVISTGLLAGGITAFTGPIAFIGVAIPHIARGLFQTSNHRIILPASALCGACLLLVCDVISQLFTYPLPISTVSALFGAPVIIWIILRKKSNNKQI